MSELSSYLITDRVAHWKAVKRVSRANGGITPIEFEILAIIENLVSKKAAFATVPDIKECYICSATTLSKAINKLLELGEIKEFKRRKLHNDYYLTPTDSGRQIIHKYVTFYREEKDQHRQRILRRRKTVII